MEHDKPWIYMLWDRESGSRDFKAFGKDYLCDEIRILTPEQAEFLVDMIDDYVNKATERQRRYLDLGSDESPALNDLKAIQEELYKSAEEALQESADSFVGMSRAEVEQSIHTVNGFWKRLKEFVLGSVESGELSEEMCGLLDKAKGEEAIKLFASHDLDNSEVEKIAPDDIIREQNLVGEIRRGNIAAVVNDEMKAGDASECLILALTGDLLCQEEGLAKKLSALALLALRLSEHPDEVDFAPFAALAAARISYELVCTQKSLFKAGQLRNLVDGIDALFGDGEKVKEV